MQWFYYSTSQRATRPQTDLLDLVCNDVETEPVLQYITRETLNSGANLACDAHLDIHAHGFWEREKSTFFDIRVCHPIATHINILRQNKGIAFMKTRRKECMNDESWKSNKRPLHH